MYTYYTNAKYWQVAESIFSRISSRVSENHKKLHGVNDRISLAQAKIDKIKGSRKATQVFSGAKFPGVKEEEAYSSLYSGVHSTGPHHERYHLESRHTQVDDQVLKEKLQFYNVQLGARQRKRHGDGDSGEGLGGLPHNIPSVSSLLLFNTSENP